MRRFDITVTDAELDVDERAYQTDQGPFRADRADLSKDGRSQGVTPASGFSGGVSPLSG